MARAFAKVNVSIWADLDFIDDLTRDDKLVYHFLLAQPKMRSCGVIDIQLKRWAQRIGGQADPLTVDQLEVILEHLQALDYIRIDPDTDELAVRTFVRHDAGDTKNWKVWRGIWSSLGAVESDTLRAFVVDNMPAGAFDPKASPTAPQPTGHQTPTDSSSDYQSDCQSDEESIPNGIASGISVAASVSVSATTTEANPPHEPPDDEQEPPDGAGGGVDHSELVEQTIRLLADRELQTEIDRGKMFTSGPMAYRESIRTRLRLEHTQAITAIAVEHPRWNPHQIADHHAPPTPRPPAPPMIVPPRPADYQPERIEIPDTPEERRRIVEAARANIDHTTRSTEAQAS